MEFMDIFSFHIEHYALKITFYVQCYSVLSASSAHNSVSLYNILDLNYYLDIKVVELCISLGL